MKKTFFPTGIVWFLVINAIISVFVSLFFVNEYAFTLGWLRSFFINYFLYSFLISCFLSGGINRLILFSGKHFSWLEAPFKRLAFDFFVVVAYTFVVGLVLWTFFAIYVWKFTTWEEINWLAQARSTTVPIIVALIITTFFTCRAFLYEWKHAVIEAERMKTERLAGQYQSLKDQLNPHFLFNSLNVLSSLIYENPDLANDFVERLAKIYRYVLDVQDERLVDLSRELAFSQSYLELQKLRFGEKLEYEIGPFDEKGKQLPPLSLQLLLENAVKHNSGTREKPLRIRIFEEAGQVVVENNVQPRTQPEEESGIGLANIRQRLTYLTDKPLNVNSDNGSFKVGVPLIYSII